MPALLSRRGGAVSRADGGIAVAVAVAVSRQAPRALGTLGEARGREQGGVSVCAVAVVVVVVVVVEVATVVVVLVVCLC